MTSSTRIPQGSALPYHTTPRNQVSTMTTDEISATNEEVHDVDMIPVPKSDESNGTSTSTADEDGSDSGYNNNNNNDTASTTKWYCSMKFYVGLLLIGFVIYVIIDSVTTKYVRDGLVTFLDWIEENPLSGFFLFVIGT
jgi:hypothetical protein